MRPSSDLTYVFVKTIGEDAVTGMMNSTNRKMQDVGRRLFELCKPGIRCRFGRSF